MKYWTLESFGSYDLPENAAEVIDQANELIEAYEDWHDEEETRIYSEKLWEIFCRTGEVKRPSYWFLVDSKITYGGVETVEIMNVSDEEEAVKEGQRAWDLKTGHDKKHCDEFYICFAEQEETGSIDYDTATSFHYYC